MTDETPKKKGSLRGRGEEIMRGSDSQPEDETHYFDDEDALLQWMGADPEVSRPTTVPNQKLVDDESLYDDPDFDNIFGDLEKSEVEEVPEAESTEHQTLDDIFEEESPSFDDIFGDVVDEDGTTRPETLPDHTTQSIPVMNAEQLESIAQPASETESDSSVDIPLPETGELFADDLFNDEGVPGFTDSRSVEPRQAFNFGEDDDYAQEPDVDTSPTVAHEPAQFIDESPDDTIDPESIEIPEETIHVGIETDELATADRSETINFGDTIDEELVRESVNPSLSSDDVTMRDDVPLDKINLDEIDVPEEAPHRGEMVSASSMTQTADLFGDDDDEFEMPSVEEVESMLGDASGESSNELDFEDDDLDEMPSAELIDEILSEDPALDPNEFPPLEFDDEMPSAELLDEVLAEDPNLDPNQAPEKEATGEFLPLDEILAYDPELDIEDDIDELDTLAMPPEDFRNDSDIAEPSPSEFSGAAIDILEDQFADDEHTGVTGLLTEMTEEIEDEVLRDAVGELPDVPETELGKLPSIDDVSLDSPPASEKTEVFENEAEAFVSMLEREVATGVSDISPEQLEAIEETVDSDDVRFDDQADIAALDAMETPVAIALGTTMKDENRRQAFGLEDGAEDIDLGDAVPERGDAIKVSNRAASFDEALPRIEEEDTEPVSLQGKRLGFGIVDRLNPREPEQLNPDELPPDWFDVEEDSQPIHVSLGGGESDAPDEEIDLDTFDEDDETKRSGDLPETITGELTQPRVPRRPAQEIFQSRFSADENLLDLFVDDNRLRELYAQIEALQDEVVESVRGARGNTDIYQEELLHASNLLLQSRENYDEARAIMYRVRADLNRERRVDSEVKKYYPNIMLYYMCFGVALVVLLLLGSLFITVAESLGVPLVGYGHNATVAGGFGALMYGFWALHLHTSVLRDFDANSINLYIFYPILGMLAGFITYFLLLLPSGTANAEAIGNSPATWIAAVAAGAFNWRIVDFLLESFRQRFSTNESSNNETSNQRAGF